MTTLGAPEMSEGNVQAGLATASQSVMLPPRSTSHELPESGDGVNALRAGSSTGQGTAGAARTLGGAGQIGGNATVPSDVRSESIGRGSKRSLTGRRKEGSIGSKRSAQLPASANEKFAAPATASGATLPQPAKKKGGFLSFLSCCGAPDEQQGTGLQESAQPAKPITKLQPTRAQPPPQSRQQDVSVPGTEATESKEVLDEKTALAANTNSTPAPVLNEKSVAVASPEPQLAAPSSNPSVPHATPELVRPQTADRQAQSTTLPGAAGIAGVAGVAGVAGAGAAALFHQSRAAPQEETSNAAPQATEQQATPDATQAEEELISDRTPHQRAVDEDIEMKDADGPGPALPLSKSEAEQLHASEEERLASEREIPTQQSALPGPPPLPTILPVSQQTNQTGDIGTDNETSTRDEDRKWLLPPLRQEFRGRKCLVLDLDETLVHSSFKILHQADFTIPVEIEGQYHNVYVIKRPGVDAFMKRMGELYEVVVFTASVSKYGDPLLDQLDIHHVVHHRLFRESCYNHQGNYVKDLSMVGRDLRETIIIDNSPTSYIFHPQHAVPISSWFSDAHDNELIDLIPVMEDLAGPQVSDVSIVLDVAL